MSPELNLKVDGIQPASYVSEKNAPKQEVVIDGGTPFDNPVFDGGTP